MKLHFLSLTLVASPQCRTVCVQLLWLRRNLQNRRRQGEDDSIVDGGEGSGEHRQAAINLQLVHAGRLLLSERHRAAQQQMLAGGGMPGVRR